MTLNGIKNELSRQQKAIEELLEDNVWLDPHENYQIDPSFSIEQAKNDLKAVEAEVDKLKRSARTNIDDHSYQKLSEQYKNLLEKRSTLEKGKQFMMQIRLPY